MMLAVLLLLITCTFAQNEGNNFVFKYSFSLDSAGTAESSTFNIAKYDEDNFISNPNTMLYNFTIPSGDTIKFNVYLYTKSQGFEIPIDTIAFADSLTSTTVSGYQLFNQNNIKGEDYYLSIENLATGNAVTSGKITLIYPKKER